jgi:small neutral amino acid transporter SnatA (MarC family)
MKELESLDAAFIIGTLLPGVASGIILVILAVAMLVGQPGGNGGGQVADRDPMDAAVFPLVVHLATGH